MSSPELKKAKTSYTVMHYLDEQAKAARLESLYRSKTKALEDAETRIKTLEKHCEKFRTEAQEMEKKYKALFDAVEAQNHKADKHKTSGDNVRKKADELSVVYYKDLVREKDKEIQTLQKRIKRLSASELRSKLSRRHGDQERQELSDRIASLAYDLDRAQEAQKELQFTSAAQETTDVALVQKHDQLADLLEAEDSGDEHSKAVVAEDDEQDDGLEEDCEYAWQVRTRPAADVSGTADEVRRHIRPAPGGGRRAPLRCGGPAVPCRAEQAPAARRAPPAGLSPGDLSEHAVVCESECDAGGGVPPTCLLPGVHFALLRAGKYCPSLV